MIRHSLTVKRCGTDIAKSTLEALSGMAFDLFRNQTQKNSLTERLSLALKSMLKVSKKEQLVFRKMYNPQSGRRKFMLLMNFFFRLSSIL